MSDLSESPYKHLSEKKIIFKILDKHAMASVDRRKRHEYMDKKAFIKGLFNDHSLHWEMRNNSTRANNYAGVSVLRNTYSDEVRY